MATIDKDLAGILEDCQPEFTPYHKLDRAADALTVYFKDDPDYSKRLTDHVTLYLSIETDKVVGCRIKGISGILENLPNFVHVNHGQTELALVFLPFFGEASDEARRAIGELGKLARQAGMALSTPE
ncbi:MAG: hypothetical protein R6U98_27870 [Pirellulaceae bacterium]